MDVIDTFLATFIAYIDSGFGLLAGDVAYLSTTLIAIDITLAGLFWALSQNTHVIAGLLKKVLYVGFFAFIIGNFSLLAGIVFDSFAELGVTAGGGTMTADDLQRPGFIAGVGLDAGQPCQLCSGSQTGVVITAGQCLAHQPLGGDWIGGDVCAQHLHRDLAAERGLQAEVDIRHRPATQ